MTRSRGRGIAAVVALALMVVLLAGCAATADPTAVEGPDAAGFWLGLWQGFIAPVAFVVSLFNPSVGIYEVHNNGGWYDFGFVFGMSVFFSGGGASAGGRSRRSKGSTEHA